MQPATQEDLDGTPGLRVKRSNGLTFTIDRRAHEARVAVAGELDIATQDSIYHVVVAILQPPIRAVLLDLDGITFCGAAGVTALIAIGRAAARADIRLVLTGIRRPVRRVLDLTGPIGLPVAHAPTIGREKARSIDMAFAGSPRKNETGRTPLFRRPVGTVHETARPTLSG